jgi:hypothetical protein
MLHNPFYFLQNAIYLITNFLCSNNTDVFIKHMLQFKYPPNCLKVNKPGGSLPRSQENSTDSSTLCSQEHVTDRNYVHNSTQLTVEYYVRKRAPLLVSH